MKILPARLPTTFNSLLKRPAVYVMTLARLFFFLIGKIPRASLCIAVVEHCCVLAFVSCECKCILVQLEGHAFDWSLHSPMSQEISNCCYVWQWRRYTRGLSGAVMHPPTAVTYFSRSKTRRRGVNTTINRELLS